MKSNLLLFFIFATLCHFNYAQNTWQSSLIKYDTINGKITYLPDPETGIKIPDFSNAGYMGGGIQIPDIPEVITISPIDGDNTLHIQNAIDRVSEYLLNEKGFRGAVLLQPGEYPVSGIISIKSSGVILRGSGSGEDPLQHTHILATGNTPAGRSVIEIGGGENTVYSREISGTRSNILTPKVDVGDKQFRVENVDSYQVGDNIIIYHPCTEAWLEAIEWGATGTDESWSEGSQPILYHSRIENIKADTIFIKSPVFNVLDRKLTQSYIYKYDNEGFIEQVGLENLRIIISHNAIDSDDKDHAKNAVHYTQVKNAWASGCELYNFYYSGILLETANQVTIANCKALTPKGPTRGGYKYNFNVSNGSQNILFTNCVASEARHAFVSNGTSSVAGIVFHNCTSLDPHTASEGHRRWTTGMLYDNFRDKGNNPGRVLGLYNRGDWGTGHGWSTANSVAWNSDVRRQSGPAGQIVIQQPPTAQNFAIGCRGTVDGDGPYKHKAGFIEGTNRSNDLVPQSLYLAQLYDRLNIDPEQKISFGQLQQDGTFNITLPCFFSSNMIFQQQTPVMFWGEAVPNVNIIIALENSSTMLIDTVLSDYEGQWNVEFPSQTASFDPYTVTFMIENEPVSEIVLENVLCGDVWFAGGQSNMEKKVDYLPDGSQVAKAANEYPEIRSFRARYQMSETPLDTLRSLSGSWFVCDSANTMDNVSAVAYVYALELTQAQEIPIGILQSYRGGTEIETWMSPEIIRDEADLLQVKKRMHTMDPKGDNARNNYPTIHYNGQIHPLINYPIKGFIFYQGESNTKRALEYKKMMKFLIKDWRQKWNMGNLPFYYVQLFNMGVSDETLYEESHWADLRNQQLELLNEGIDNIGMVVTIDTNEDPNNPVARIRIHPRNKKPIGHRLALLSRDLTYAEDVIGESPFPKANYVRNDSIFIEFKHIGTGLKTLGDGEELRGFVIADRSGNFQLGMASILNDSTVVITSSGVTKPVAVRYAWAKNPDCNLANSVGLPASPFKTDDWESLYEYTY